MGLGGISIWQLLIVLAIVILIFGTKRFKNIGSDLGNALKGFKKAMSDDDKTKDNPAQLNEQSQPTSNASAKEETKQQ